MDHAVEGVAADRSALSRREVVGGGAGLILGAMFLGGCQTKKVTAGLPDPVWQNQGPIYAQQQPYIPAQVQPPTPVVPQQPVPTTMGPIPDIIPRSQWTSMGVSRPREINPMNGVRRMTIHHDGMPPKNVRSMGEVRARIEQIRSAHVGDRGWADIGYHYIIDPAGRIWEGRQIQYQGAHVKDQNENNLGILVMGNFEIQQPTSAQVQSLDRFVSLQMQRYRMGLSNVRTHQERAPTECPGRNLQGYLNRSRSRGGQIAMMASRVGLG
jgi:hypothetical protein